MGGRLSTPRSPSGAEESSLAAHRAPTYRDRFPFTINRRTILAPLALLTIAPLAYMYAFTAAAAAKENARRAREADGGAVSWRREGLRRHGRLDKYEERGLLDQLRFGSGRREGEDAERGKGRSELEGAPNPIEEGIRRAREGKGGRRGDGS